MTSDTPTPAELVERSAELALEEIRSAASSLRRALVAVRRDADQALDAMSRGQMVFGAHSYGPIGLQAPADVAAATAHVTRVARFADALGVPTADIEAAYTAGFNR